MRTFCNPALTLWAVVSLGGPAAAQPNLGYTGFNRSGDVPGAAMLLMNKSVQEELKLTADEVAKLSAPGKKLRDNLTQQEAAIKAANEEAAKLARDTLKPDQFKRFGQIALQVKVDAAFDDDEVQKALMMTDLEKDEIKKKEYRAIVARYVDPDPTPLPDGAVARIGSTRLRHAGEVSALRYSPDGKWLASVSTSPQDATARLWDAATGKEQLVVKIKINVVEPNRVRPDLDRPSLGFTADARTFLVIDAASLRGVDIQSGKEVFAHPIVKDKDPAPKRPLPFGKRSPPIMGAGIAPDGKTFVRLKQVSIKNGRSENSVEIGDVATGKIVRTVDASVDYHADGPVEFSPDSRHFVVNGCVIDVASAKEISRIEGSDDVFGRRWVQGARFLPGAAALVWTDGSVFDWQTGKRLRGLEMEKGMGALALSPDGKVLVAGPSFKTAYPVIDTATGKEIARLPGMPSSKVLAFSPDGKRLAGVASAYSGAITVWDMTTHDFHPTAAEPGGFFGVHFVGDANTLGIRERGHPLLDWRTGRILERLADVGGDRLPRPVLSPDRKWYVHSEFNDPAIRILDAKTGQESKRLTIPKGQVRGFSVSRDSSRLAAGCSDNTIRIFDVKSGDEIAQLTAPEMTGQDATSFSDDGRIVAARINALKLAPQNGSVIYVWDVDAKKQLARMEASTQFFGTAMVSPNGKWVAGGGGRRSARPKDDSVETDVQIWDAATGRPVHALPGHSAGQVRASAWCEFSADSRWLITGDAAGKLRLWEVATGQEIHSFVGHRSTVIAHFSPDSKLLVAASEEAPCLIWDVLGAAANPKPATADELQACWKDLEDADAKKAFAAIRRFAASPGPGVKLLRQNLKLAVGVDPKKVQDLLRDLNSDRFKEREAATAELIKLADRLEPTLRELLKSTKSADERDRLDQVLKTLQKPSLKRIQEGRALTALELLATPEAAKFLADLAAGARDDLLTQGAVDAVRRLGRRGGN